MCIFTFFVLIVTILLLLNVNRYFILMVMAIIYIYYVTTKVQEYNTMKKATKIPKSHFEIRPTRSTTCVCGDLSCNGECLKDEMCKRVEVEQLEETPPLLASESGNCHYDTQIDRDADDMAAFHARKHNYETRSIVTSGKRKEVLNSYIGGEFKESEDSMHFAGSTYF
jgi:hypothetical protein